MTCPRCQQENPSQAKFCLECGTPLALRCPQCGTPLPAGAKFCVECAAAVGAFGSEPRFASPEAYTPRHLAERIIDSKSALEGERKQVTVLFADLKDSMELLAERDPEEARKILDPVLEHMMEAVHRYEGTVNQVMGDGIMALFGAPVAHEDHAVRACYAALSMQENVKRYAEEVRHSRAAVIKVRIGLNSGEVVVRAIGSDLRMHYSAVGQTTHLAARMEQIADPGAIVITPSTLALAEGRVEVKPLGPVAVRGLADAVEVYEVTGPGPARTRLHVAAGRGLAPLVGRAAALEQLELAMGEAQARRGRVVAVIGEPGIGKSRLLHELTLRPRSDTWRILECGGVAYGAGMSYLPIVTLLKNWVGIEARDSQRQVGEKLVHTVLTVDRTLEPTLPALAALLDAPIDDREWSLLVPPERRRRIMEGMKRLLLCLSEERPLLLLCEDLHWVDDGTQALLDGLVESVADARLLLVVTYRPEYQHHWGGQPRYEEVRLETLSPEAASELLTGLLGPDASLASLKRMLMERAGGNPLFLEESVRALAETRALVGERGARRLTRDVGTIRVPATVQAVLAARIDRLETDEKRLLQSAAVIGKDVPYAILSAISGLADEPLRHGLARLQSAKFLYETRLFPESEYAFEHALTQEVAYGTLLHERRRALHARIVEAIETLHGDRVAEHVDQLGSHALQGELWDKAVGYLQQAGTKAFDRSANRQAVAYYEEALTALERVRESAETVARAIDLRFHLRNSLHALGRFERVVGYLREAEALSRQLGDQRRLGWALGYQTHFFTMRGDYDRAVAAGRSALAIAEEVREPGVTVIANAYLGLAHLAQGNYRGAAEFHQKTMIAAAGGAAGDRASLVALTAAYAGGFLAWSLAELGDFTEGVAWGHEAMTIADSTKHPYTEIVAKSGVGYLYRRRGDLDNAIPLLEHSLALCQTTDNRILLPFVASLLGSSYVLSRRLSEGLRLLAEAVEVAVSIRLAVARPLPVGLLGEAYLLAGRLDRAFEEAARALELARKHGERGFEGWAHLLFGDIHLHGQSSEAAAESYNQALAIGEESGMRPLVAHCHLGLGRLDRRPATRERVQPQLVTAAMMYREMGMTYWLAKAEAAMAEWG